jgi:hypothetical protein
MNFESSSAFAMFWNLCRSNLPSEILDDLVAFCDNLGIYKMDPKEQDGHSASGGGMYRLTIQGLPITFHDVPMAPPTGVMASNYAR